MKNICCSLIILILFSCKEKKETAFYYSSDDLKIEKISAHSYLHTTYLNTEKYSNIPCNGLIYINNGEAIVFDTPVKNDVSKELITFIEEDLESTVKFVVINHFHVDCLGGLKAFHDQDIVSIANEMTIKFAANTKEEVPQQGFSYTYEVAIGGQKIINSYLGEGHTKDNIVSYIPSENILFGGCLIKSLKSGKGNLDDANTDAWSETVSKVKRQYPNVRYVIPGHGRYGGVELLDYTIQMFGK